MARGEEPALERGPRGTAVPSQTLINQAVYAVGQIAIAHVERILADISADLLRDGVSRNDLVAQVRSGLSRLTAERMRILAPELLAATPPALMKLALTLRHVDVPAPAAPGRAEAATFDAPATITKETFRELAMVDLVVSEDGEARLRAVDAITRFGSAAAFIPLRNALVLRPWDTAWDIDHALRELTFTGYGRSAIADPNEWDDWLRRNRGMTRRQWAEEAFSLARPDPTSGDDLPAVKAFEYLRHLPNPPRGIVEKAVRSRLWEIRVAAATAIAPSDRVLAMGLLLRELQNRSLGACRYSRGETGDAGEHTVPVRLRKPGGTRSRHRLLGADDLRASDALTVRLERFERPSDP